MKILKNSLLICSLVLLLGNCRRDDSDALPANTSIEKGGLAFIVKDQSDALVPGVSIGIALRQEDLATNTYFATRISDSNGRANFGDLQPDNYYYEADAVLNNQAVHAEGMAVVEGGKKLELQITVH